MRNKKEGCLSKLTLTLEETSGIERTQTVKTSNWPQLNFLMVFFFFLHTEGELWIFWCSDIQIQSSQRSLASHKSVFLCVRVVLSI